MGTHLNYLSCKLPVIAICGATGTGKSKLAIDLASQFNSEVINADAVQQYKGLNIATNKVTPDESRGVVHHLLGFLEPIDGFRYNVHHYRRDCCTVIEKLKSEFKPPIIVGGTHYYIEAVLWQDFLRNSCENEMNDTFKMEPNDIKYSWPTDLLGRLPADPKDYYSTLMNLDPNSALRLHPNDTRKLRQALLSFYAGNQVESSEKTPPLSLKRSMKPRFVPPESLIIWLDADLTELRPKLDERVSKMVSRGLIKELDEFLSVAAQSILPNQSVINSDGSVSEEAKVEIFQLANEGLLPSVGADHWCRGALQSIGFKEFEAYLKLSTLERSSDHGEAVLKEAIEKMKIATRLYAKRQVGWIKNRFLRRPAQGGIPVYRLDVTPILKAQCPEEAERLWKSTVLEPCLATLRGECSLSPEPFTEPLLDLSKPIPPPPYICASCNGRIFNYFVQFQEHLQSKTHKRRLESLKKRAKNNRLHTDHSLSSNTPNTS